MHSSHDDEWTQADADALLQSTRQALAHTSGMGEEQLAARRDGVLSQLGAVRKQAHTLMRRELALRNEGDVLALQRLLPALQQAAAWLAAHPVAEHGDGYRPMSVLLEDLILRSHAEVARELGADRTQEVAS